MPTPILQSVTQTTSTTVVLRFDQAMSFGDGSINVSDGYSQSYLSGGNLLQRLIGTTDSRQMRLIEGDNAGADDGQISISGNNVTITFSSPLKAGLSYSVTMGHGTLYSSAGGDEGGFGVSSFSQYKFTASGSVTAPVAPTAVAGAVIHFIDNGASSTDYITSIGAQTVTGTFTGTLGTKDFVQVSLDNGASWHQATTSGNNWSYTGGIETANLVAVSGGLGGTMLARVTNTSALSTATASQSYVYTGVVANTAALTGHAVSLSSASDTGALDSDGITQSATSVDLNVQGLHGFHAGDTVRIMDVSNGGVVVGQYVIQSGDLYNGTGDYISAGPENADFRASLSVTLNEALSVGTHSLVAVMVDKAGVVSSAPSSAGTITVDLAAPTISDSTPVNESISVSVGIDKLEITFNENIAIEDGTVVTIAEIGNPSNVQEVTLHSGDIVGNKLTITLAAPLGENTQYEVKGATISDMAGNDGVTGDTAFLQFTTGTQPVVPTTPGFTINDTAPASDDPGYPYNREDNHTADGTIHVTGVTSGEWYYRLSPNDGWTLGNSSYTFQLTGSATPFTGKFYSQNEIQVKQVLNGVDSAIFSNDVGILYQTSGPTVLQDQDATSGFNNGGKAITGHMSNSTNMLHEFVEVTLDGGNTWLRASTTADGAGAFNWSLDLNAGSDSLGDAVGVRVVDRTGAAGSFPLIGKQTQYYLADDDATYTHSADSAIVFGGAGADTITVGNGSYVEDNAGNNHITAGDSAWLIGGAGNDTFVVGEYAYIDAKDGANVITAGTNASLNAGDGANTITAGADSYVTAGNGANTITFGAGAFITAGNGGNIINATAGATNIITGSGNDTIDLGVNYGAITLLDAGAGVDTLKFSAASATLDGMVSALGMSGIDVLELQGGTTLNLGANGVGVTALSDDKHLTINGDGSNSVVMGANWSLYDTGASYAEYHSLDGAVVLIAVAMLETL